MTDGFSVAAPPFPCIWTQKKKKPQRWVHGTEALWHSSDAMCLPKNGCHHCIAPFSLQMIAEWEKKIRKRGARNLTFAEFTHLMPIHGFVIHCRVFRPEATTQHWCHAWSCGNLNCSLSIQSDWCSLCIYSFSAKKITNLSTHVQLYDQDMNLSAQKKSAMRLAILSSISIVVFITRWLCLWIIHSQNTQFSFLKYIPSLLWPRFFFSSASQLVSLYEAVTEMFPNSRTNLLF